MVVTEIKPSRWRVFAYDRNYAGRGPMFVGFIVLVPLFVGLVIWASLAPINAAAIAPGEIVLSSDRKTIQHLEGGLITKIYVREGEFVERDMPLLEIQDLEEQARQDALLVQLVNTNAQIARLIAERERLSSPNFENIANGLNLPQDTIDRFADTHRSVFFSLVETEQSAQSLASSRSQQIAREIDGLQVQLTAKKREEEIVSRELSSKRKLFERGLVLEAEVNSLSRSEAILVGEVGALKASIAKLEQSILDQEVEISRLRTERTSTLLGELQQAQIGAENIRQELRTLEDRQQRSVIRAPASGLVLGMQVHTIGAVASPGVALMDIVPQDDDLLIEARVNPIDIDLVSPGMDAQIMLSAFSAKKVEKLPARVLTVSGDIVMDELSGERYFLARLLVDQEAILSLPSSVELSPGMPADVFLIAGERTVAEYLLAPILDAAFRAFREE